MSILDSFYILFDSDASKLDKGLAETEKKSDKLIDKLRGVDKEGAKAGASLYDLIGKGAGLLGVGLSIGALIAGVKSTAAAYDELGKLATRFRSTAEAVDEFRDAAGLLDISEEKSVGALHALDTAIQDTFLGMGRAKKVFEELGVTITDANGKIKPTTQVMGELAEKMKGMEKGTQIRVMERLGLDPSLLKMFNADMMALQKRMSEVDKASGFNLEQAVKRSAEYTKASKGLSLEVNTLKMYIEKLTEGFKISTLPFFTDAMTTATKYVRAFTDFVLKHSTLLEGVFIAIGAAIAYFLIPAAISGAVALWAIIAPFALIGLAVIAVGALFALLYDDIMNFIDGGDSMVGHIINKWPIVGEVLKGLGAEFVFLWDIAKAVFTFLVGMFDDPAAAFEKFKSDIAAGIDRLIETFPGLKEVIGTITAAFTAAGDTITGVWDAVVAAVKAAIAVVMDAINTVVSGFNKAKAFLGMGGEEKGAAKGAGASPTGAASGSLASPMPADTRAAVARGKEQLGAASGSPLVSQTSNSISNTAKASKNTTVTVGKVEVKTQATDAQGISKAIGGTMQAQMRQAANNFDDGVLA